MQSIVQGTSPVWSKNMARIKSRHYFEIGELVVAHPIVSLIYKDTERGEYGIVLQRYPPKHPTKDFRKVRVMWQKSLNDETYYAHHLFHLYHEEEIDNLYGEWEEKLKTSKYADILKQRSLGLSSSFHYSQIAEGLGISIDKYPLSNPCKGFHKK